LKKLINLGLVEGDRRKKEKFFATTKEGRDACKRYREIREECLVKSLNVIGSALDKGNHDIGGLAGLLRALSGLYDQAARAASSF